MQTQPRQEPTPPPVRITIVGEDGKTQTIIAPRSTGEVEALLARREQLSDQLSSVSERRQEISEQLRTAPAESRPGLTDRLKVLDQRILQLENEIAKTGEQLAAAPGDLVSFTEERRVNPGGGDDDFMAGMAVGAVPLLTVLGGVYLWRRRRSRKLGGVKQAPLLPESAKQLERLEQGMEAIAIEVERISEGQRFVTKLLAESQGERVIK